MTGIEIATLIIGIIEKVGAIAVKLLASGSGKTAEEVKQEIKDGLDELDDNWLEAEVKKNNEKFLQPGG